MKTEVSHLAGYYRGRRALVGRLAAQEQPSPILEVGCGSGTNLLQLARAFPEAELHGLDLSGHMLERARRKLAPFGTRIHFHHQAYSDPIPTGSRNDTTE